MVRLGFLEKMAVLSGYSIWQDGILTAVESRAYLMKLILMKTGKLVAKIT